MSLSLGAVPAQVMSCVASTPERFEENLGQPLVFLDGMAQGFDVGFLCERFDVALAHLRMNRMKYAAVITTPAANAAIINSLSSSFDGGRLIFRFIRHPVFCGDDLRDTSCITIALLINHFDCSYHDVPPVCNGNRILNRN